MDQPLRVLIDDHPDGSVPILDRGLHYGHGVFETIRVARGRPTLWDYHCDRMLDGCGRLGIALQRDRVEASVLQVLGRSDSAVVESAGVESAVAESAGVESAAAESAVLKIIVTAGSAERGYRFDEPATARLVLLLLPAPKARHTRRLEGIAVRVCNTRLAEQPALAGIKHLNRLEQVLARREWSDPSIEEGLMRDQGDRFVEGIQSNLFVVRDAAILTPSLHRAGVAGVMRRFLLEHKPGCAELTIEQTDLYLTDLEAADECFLTNSVMGVIPVTQVHGIRREWRRPVGKITRRVADAVEHEIGFGDQN